MAGTKNAHFGQPMKGSPSNAKGPSQVFTKQDQSKAISFAVVFITLVAGILLVGGMVLLQYKFGINLGFKF